MAAEWSKPAGMSLLEKEAQAGQGKAAGRGLPSMVSGNTWNGKMANMTSVC
jgi:hypothetical protein